MSSVSSNVTSPQKAGARSIGARLLISLALTLLFLIAGETLAFLKLRLHPSRRFDPELTTTVYKGESWAEQYGREFRASGLVEYHPYVIWRRAPYAGKTISIDSEGLRRTFHSPCDTDAYTIWMFGNSQLWGVGSPDWDTIPSFLAKEYSNAGKKVCVKNYGEKAWVSTQELFALILELKHTRRRPDLVIFYDGTTDSFLPYAYDQDDVHQNFLEVKNGFEKSGNESAEVGGFSFLEQTNTYIVLRELRAKFSQSDRAIPVGALARRNAVPADASAMAQRTLRNYLSNVDVVETLASHYHFRCAFFWHPSVRAGSKPLTSFEERLRLREEQKFPDSEAVFRATYEAIRDLKRPDLYYLGDVFKDHSESLYIEANHVGPEGNRLIAQQIFRLLNGLSEGKNSTTLDVPAKTAALGKAGWHRQTSRLDPGEPKPLSSAH
jgi:hypothetical protein